MINGYFTPKLEDIRIGYEYETTKFIMDGKQYPWKSKVINDEKDMMRIMKMPLTGFVRVAYLNKNQIEAEGWELVSEIPENPHEKYWGLFRKGSYEMRFWLGDEGWLEVYELIEDGHDCLFQGRCDDVNTLRQVTKLLQI